MVKLKEIPTEKPQVDLAELPQTNVLKATKEEMREEKEGKTGGLVITFEQKDGKELSQKYSKISGSALLEALEKLGYADTTELQKSWHEYKLTSMRAGYPRYIPVKRIA